MSAGDPGVEAVLALLGPADTSVIVCDLVRLRDQLALLRQSFPSAVDHAVAIKTMPHPRMLAYLVGQGFGLEAASFEEVELARAAGAGPDEIIWDSPVKTRGEIARAEAELPGMLCNANSLAELGRYQPESPLVIGLRINPELETTAPHLYDVGGPGSQFGVPLSRRDEILAAAEWSGFEVLHLHIGSQLGSTQESVAAIGALVDLADQIDRRRAAAGSPRRIHTLDIGGGLAADPASLSPGKPSILARFGQALARDVPRLFDRRVRTEFGQWIHTHAGWAASRVEYVDDGDHPRAFIHLGADFFLRDVYTDPRPFGFARRSADSTVSRDLDSSYDLVGPLCFAGDTLGSQMALPLLHEDDWLIIEGTGANTYGLWSRHCSRDVPAVVAVDGAVAEVWSPRRPVG